MKNNNDNNLRLLMNTKKLVCVVLFPGCGANDTKDAIKLDL